MNVALSSIVESFIEKRTIVHLIVCEKMNTYKSIILLVIAISTLIFINQTLILNIIQQLSERKIFISMSMCFNKKPPKDKYDYKVKKKFMMIF